MMHLNHTKAVFSHQCPSLDSLAHNILYNIVINGIPKKNKKVYQSITTADILCNTLLKNTCPLYVSETNSDAIVNAEDNP